MIENKNFNPPGIVWVILIVVAVSAVEYFQAQLPGDPLIWQFVVVGLMAALKSIKVEDVQLKQALDIIDKLRTQILGKQTRGIRMSILENDIEDQKYVDEVVLDDKVLGIPEPRSKASRLFLG